MATFGAAISMKDNFSNSLIAINTGLEKMVNNFGGTSMAASKAADRTESFGSKTVSTLAKIGASWGVLKGIQGGIGLSDQYAGTTARLNLMNDGMRTTAQLQEAIFQSSMRTRSSYQDSAAIIGKLGILAGHAFKNNEEQIFFAEQMNKQFKIGGASIQEQQSAMYQLTQAMASGRLQGDEFRAIIENAPILAQAIAKHFGKSIGEMKELSSQGMITANDIKMAMVTAAEETDRRFKELPVTFGEGWVMFQNIALRSMEPVWKAMGKIANSEAVTNGLNAIIPVLDGFAWLIAGTIHNMIWLGSVISENWGMIAPIVGGALGILAINLTASAIAMGSFAVSAALATIASWSETVALIAMEYATHGLTGAFAALNGVMAMSPIGWIALAIVAIVAIIYIAVAAFNKWAGTSYSATGLIMGAIAVMVAYIWNNFAMLVNFLYNGFVVPIYNGFAMMANFLANVFTNPIGAVKRLFYDLADYVLNLLQTMARAIDNLFGSKLAGSIDTWRSTLAGKAKASVPNYNEVVAKMDNKNVLERIDLGKQFGKYYDIGDNLTSSPLTDSLDTGMGNMANSSSETAKNTKGMKDSLEISSEDLKYLKDAAEQEIINRFSLAEIKVDMTNHNNVNSSLDLDDMVDVLNAKITEMVTTMAEEVHE